MSTLKRIQFTLKTAEKLSKRINNLSWIVSMFVPGIITLRWYVPFSFDGIWRVNAVLNEEMKRVFVFERFTKMDSVQPYERERGGSIDEVMGIADEAYRDGLRYVNLRPSEGYKVIFRESDMQLLRRRANEIQKRNNSPWSIS